MMNHTNCPHPRTPAGRAACRKAAAVTPPAEVIDYSLAFNTTDDTRLIFAMEAIASHEGEESEWACVMSGQENGDATASEDGFQVWSPEWDTCTLGSIEFMMDVHGHDFSDLVKRAEAHRAAGN